MFDAHVLMGNAGASWHLMEAEDAGSCSTSLKCTAIPEDPGKRFLTNPIQLADSSTHM